MQYRFCPICDGAKTDRLKKIEMKIPRDYRLPDSYDVVSCLNCGFVYADTSASMEDYDWYYTHCNFYGDDSKDDNSNRYAMVEEFLEKYVNRESVMLELGAGNGRFELSLKHHGYVNIVGSDPSVDSVKRLLSAGISSYVGSVYSSVPEQEKERYDCIFLFEVAEHLLAPGEGVRNIGKMLKSNGFFIVSVPDYSRIGEDVNSVPNYFNLEHINYFSETSLDNLMSLYDMSKIDKKHMGNDLIQVYQKTGRQKEICQDTATRQAVCSYFKLHKRKEERIYHIIEELKIKQREIAIWGTGSYVMNLTATTALLDCNIKGFVDNNKIKQGRSMYGYEIYPPEFLVDKRYAVLICSMLNSREIKEQLEEMYTENDIVIL